MYQALRTRFNVPNWLLILNSSSQNYIKTLQLVLNYTNSNVTSFFEGITLRKVKQPQKDKYYTVPLYIRELEQPNSERRKVEMVIARAWK